VQLRKINLKIVNVHYGFKCNLGCKQCITASDFLDHTRYDPSLEETIQTVDNLHQAVGNVEIMITLLGGEPLLYWDRVSILAKHIRKRFPLATINITTNGLLLHKYQNSVIELLLELDNCKLTISNHMTLFAHDKVAQVSYKNLNLFLSDPRLFKIHDYHYDIPNHSIDIHMSENGIKFINQYKLLPNGQVKPYATNDPEGSMIHGCTGSICSFAKNNKLYKCSKLAVLPNVLDHTNQLDDPDWQKYLNYQYIDLTATTQEQLDYFEETQGKPISECDGCPNQQIEGVTTVIRTKENVLRGY